MAVIGSNVNRKFSVLRYKVCLSLVNEVIDHHIELSPCLLQHGIRDAFKYLLITLPRSRLLYCRSIWYTISHIHTSVCIDVTGMVDTTVLST